jgi:phenylalanyl-tRNA synthetase beta chain
VRILTALGFSATGTGDVLEVWVPSWRRDVQGEPDLVEEVARIASLTKLEPKPMRRPKPGVPAPVLTQGQLRERAARRTMAALGYNECVTYSFIDEASAKLFGGGDDATRLENPISSEMSHMRPALLPGLLQAAARNQARGMMDLALFEVGHAFHGGEPTEQHLQATGLLVGQSGPRDPHGARGPSTCSTPRRMPRPCCRPWARLRRRRSCAARADWWHPGRHGMICLGPKKVLGIFGELHPRGCWRRWT